MKSRRLLLGGIAIVVLAVIVVWACRSEYGSGYSEDQRRNWNEGIKKMGENSTAYIDFFLNKPYSESASVLRNWQLRSDAPIWELDLSETQVALPLEGLSIVRLMELADKGDGDACLELVFRSFDDSPVSMSLGIVFQSEKYLKKAVALGRPGADFLLKLFEAWKKYGDDVRKEDVEGYRAFLSYLDAGDFLLGKVYFYLNPEGVSELDRLTAGLDKKAGGGDVVSIRNRGYVELLKMGRGQGYQWMISLSNQRTDDLRLNEMLFALQELLSLQEKTCTKIRRIYYWFSNAWYLKQVQRSLREPFSMLTDAAERGDLHAKFLWVRYSVWSGMKFSQKDWNRHLRYTDELIKAGGRYVGEDLLDFDRDQFPLESFFYEKTSIDRTEKLIKQRQEKEYKTLFPNAMDDTSLLKSEMEAKCDMMTFAHDYVKDVLGGDEKGKERMRGFDLMKQAAEEGNPFALYGLFLLLNEGILVKQDAGQAWALLQRLKTWREGVYREGLWSGMVVVNVEKSEDVVTNILDSCLDDALEYHLLDVIARHGDRPEMTVKQAFDQFVQEHVEKESGMRKKLRGNLKAHFEKRGFKVTDEKK